MWPDCASHNAIFESDSLKTATSQSLPNLVLKILFLHNQLLIICDIEMVRIVQELRILSKPKIHILPVFLSLGLVTGYSAVADTRTE